MLDLIIMEDCKGAHVHEYVRVEQLRNNIMAGCRSCQFVFNGLDSLHPQLLRGHGDEIEVRQIRGLSKHFYISLRFERTKDLELSLPEDLQSSISTGRLEFAINDEHSLWEP